MPSYSQMRAWNGAESLIIGILLFVYGVMLIHRGYAERSEWVHRIPGRIVFGAFLTLVATIEIQAAVAKLFLRNGEPGAVGRYINNWYVNLLLAVAIVLGCWSVRRFWKNTLNHDQLDSAARAADALERTALATEKIADGV